jgi:hypothetical protein
MPKLVDRTGQQFDRLTVIARGENSKHGKAQWLCKCVCGNSALVIGSALKSGNTQSCGCLQKEIHTTHGMTKTATHNSYRAAKSRCENPKTGRYKWHGGRGIKFLYASFEEFFEDMGVRPPGMTLERCDNDGHYEPGNCRWANLTEQANNKRSNTLITAFGRTRTMARWAREIGVSSKTLGWRLRAGWMPEDALARPIDQSARRGALVRVSRSTRRRRLLAHKHGAQRR